jgi:hypothetical protein
MRVAIVQSAYIPWKGYFDLIAGVDAFVLYDDAQFTRRDWRNRNKIKTPRGASWLTIPVQVSGRYLQPIRDVVVDDPKWADVHWRSVMHQYRRAEGWADCREPLEALYRSATSRWLSEINVHSLRGILQLLDIRTSLRWSSEFTLSGDRTGKLVDICRQLGATRYLSGPMARTYLDPAAFHDAGIAVDWADYSGYREYRQLYPPFDHHVSIVDLLLNEGHRARDFLKST